MSTTTENINAMRFVLKKLTFVNKSTNPDPEYKCAGDSGFDLRAWITKDNTENTYTDDNGQLFVTLRPLERRLIHTGIYCKLPSHTELQVRSRSGCTLKYGIVVANGIGTIDKNYRGEICIIVVNLSNTIQTVFNGDRIAQAVLMPVYNKECVIMEKVNEITTDTERSDGGFGHTGHR